MSCFLGEVIGGGEMISPTSRFFTLPSEDMPTVAAFAVAEASSSLSDPRLKAGFTRPFISSVALYLVFVPMAIIVISPSWGSPTLCTSSGMFTTQRRMSHEGGSRPLSNTHLDSIVPPTRVRAESIMEKVLNGNRCMLFSSS